MNDLENIYLRKTFDTFEETEDVNAAFTFLRQVDDMMIFRRYDTLFAESSIVAIKEEEIKNKFYTAKDFFKTASYIGKTGYYKEMTLIDRMVYETFIILYRNDYHELVYDIISESLVVYPSCYQEKDFIAIKTDYEVPSLRIR